MVLAVGPGAGELAVIRKAGLSLIMRKFNGELAAGGEGNGGAILGRVVQAARDLLHPPLVLGEVVERVDRIVGIRIRLVGVGAVLFYKVLVAI